MQAENGIRAVCDLIKARKSLKALQFQYCYGAHKYRWLQEAIKVRVLIARVKFFFQRSLSYPLASVIK